MRFPALALLIAPALLTGCSDDKAGAGKADGHGTGETAELTVYSGRSETLVGPILEEYQKTTGAKLKVRYGKTAELAALLLTEGDKSPAHVFFAQDAGALGALAKKGRLSPLPASVTNKVAETYRDPAGAWVAVTGRARCIVYNTDKMKPADLPQSVMELTDPKWKGRVGWAPTNGSFQAFVTAMRVLHGEEKTKAWLEGMKKNGAKEYPKNTPIVAAAGAGEIDVGLVNHYYLYRFLKDDEGFKAANHYTQEGDVGSLVNVAGVGILKTAGAAEKKAALLLIGWLLGKRAQTYFSTETNEYPLVAGVPSPQGVPAIAERKPPKMDLGALRDLEGTLKLLREAGVLP